MMWRGGSVRYGLWPARRRLLWSRGLWYIALLSALCLLTLPTWGQSSQPTSPIGLADYQQYKLDLAIVNAQLRNYEQALRNAIDVNESISAESQKARDDLENYKANSMQSSADLLKRVETLTRQLKDSDGLVISLRRDLDLAKSTYSLALETAEKRATALERDRNIWRATTVGTVLLAVVAAVYSIVK